jgi:hypothetical protein
MLGHENNAIFLSINPQNVVHTKNLKNLKPLKPLKLKTTR